MMSKPSSPLKKVKVKSPKNFFKKNKNRELSDSPPSSTPASTHSDNGSSYSEVETPILSNSTKKMDKDGVSAFPTIPNLLSNDANNDDESVAAMSDIRERGNSLDHSWSGSDMNEDEYFKQDHSSNSRVDVDILSTVEADNGGGDVDHQNGVDETEITTTHDDGDDIIVDKNITPQRDNRGTTPAESTLSPNTPGSRVSFCDDDNNNNLGFKTPPHLNRKVDVFATPTDNSIDESLPLTPLEQLKTPGGSTNAPKVLKQNKKLRAGRKDLLKILGSTAKQFRVYEEVASQKIFELEERIRQMERRQRKSTAKVGKIEVAGASITGHADLIEGKIIEQQQQDLNKEKLISSLKLRCETLKHCLGKVEDELEEKRTLWESEVNMLSDALEKNNEALDYSVTQLERLRKWKTEHDEKEEALRVESVEKEDESKIEEEEDKGRQESQLDSKDTAATEEMEQTMAEKEQLIERLEGNLKEKGLDIVQLQTDLDSCFNEIESLKELVNKTAAAKGYEDFQTIVDNLQDEAVKSESKAVAFSERISELESDLEAKDSEILQLSMTIEEGQKSFVQHDESEVSPPTSHHPDECNIEVDSKIKQDSSEHSNDSCDPIDNIKNSLLLSLGNDSVGGSTPGSSSPGSSTPDSRRWAGLSFARKLAKEGRQYAAAVGSANDPESMMGMIRERDRRINSLEATIEANTLMIEKLKKDVERMDTEHEEAQVQSSKKIEQLEEENAVYLLQIEGFEKAFMTLNESQQTTILPSLDETPDDSNVSDKDEEVASEEDSKDLKAQNAKLERMLSELREESSFQEDQIEKLKTELTTLRVVSQQDKESACDKLRDENKIIEAQKSALENQLVEINKSAAILRDSLAQDSTSSPSKSNHAGDDQIQNDGQEGSNPILVAQVVMLENANKVLESSIDSLRSDQQEKLAPLLERIALLEEEKRIMEEEMLTKIHCREQTISNLEDSLRKATQARLTKKKKNSALKTSQQLLARATKATSDSAE